MPRQRESFPKLKIQEYDIRGNLFRVWRDTTGQIVFLLDKTQNEDKPNVLLVLHPDKDRKWDDILQNDYGIDLETVRPKKNNKYQKLDIEYDGLDVYEVLINAYEHEQDVSGLLNGLYDYRYAVSRRSAVARLNAATETMAQSQETISKTQNTIKELRKNQRELKEKLDAQKKGIGREPTKESASKILKTESRIDDNNQRIKRAEKRLVKAQRRFQNAHNEIDKCQELLMRPRPELVEENSGEVTEIKEKIRMMPQNKKVATTKDTETAVVKTIETKTERKMADEEVKPLMDQDPEIVNEANAFKPVAFDDIVIKDDSSNEQEQSKSTEITTETEKVVEEDDYMKRFIDEEIKRKKVLNEESVAKPLDFSPVKEDVTEKTETVKTVEEMPVLETITSVENPVGADVDTTGEVKVGQYEVAAEPKVESRPIPASPLNKPTRPLSPLSGTGYASTSTPQQRNNRLYYLLLIALIVLSIFTLWLFQRKNGATVPEIKTPTEETVTQQETVQPVVDFDVKSEIEEPVVEHVEVPQPEPVVVPEPEPEPVVEPEPEPVLEGNPFVGTIQTHDVILQPDTGGPNVTGPVVVEQDVPESNGNYIETETETYTEHISASQASDVATRVFAAAGISNPVVVTPAPETIVVPVEPVEVPTPVVTTPVESLNVSEPAQVVVPQPQIRTQIPQPQMVPEPAFMMEPQYIPEPRFVTPPRYNNVPAPRYNRPQREMEVHDGGQYMMVYDD